MRSPTRAFTLIEALMVIAVLGLLAALMLPALGQFKARSLIHRAHQEMNSIVSAIHQYEAVYGRFPISQRVQATAAALGEDYTYGSTFLRDDGTRIVIGGPGDYLNNNNEVMAILLDLELYSDGQPTPNQYHVKNPHRTQFLNVQLSRDTNSPGLGPDGAYRDPWGIAYIITLDLNNDGGARDFFYRNASISENPQLPDQGLFGLLKRADAKGKTVFEANTPVIVWSPGPDRMINPEKKANEGVNKDNVLSWK